MKQHSVKLIACFIYPNQTVRADVKTIRKWFATGKNNLAVVLGEVSGGLACRDFDTMDSYNKWVRKNPVLAKKLPTVKTSRGMHVYFLGDVKGRKDFKNKQGNHIGELRGSGHYCLLPPSIHPSGARYKWIIPVTQKNLIAINPELFGNIKNTSVSGKKSKRSKFATHITMCAENGGNVKELQTMARHATPDLTMNTYARARNDRLSELAEKVAQAVLSQSDIARKAN